jgi:RimJ/RimL family protein N-acetyltransferase
MKLNFKIQPLDINSAREFAEYMSKHMALSGKHGEVIYAPYEEAPAVEIIESKCAEKWLITPGKIGWRRTWGLLIDNHIVGHVELVGATIETNLHRATLGIGLLKEFRGAGFSTQAMNVIVSWASTNEFLHWIDLGVFKENTVAINIYKKFGFKIVGEIQDKFRIKDKSINEYLMSLNLKNNFSKN